MPTELRLLDRNQSIRTYEPGMPINLAGDGVVLVGLSCGAPPRLSQTMETAGTQMVALQLLASRFHRTPGRETSA